jgi:hypothetical protein
MFSASAAVTTRSSRLASADARMIMRSPSLATNCIAHGVVVGCEVVRPASNNRAGVSALSLNSSNKNERNIQIKRSICPLQFWFLFDD